MLIHVKCTLLAGLWMLQVKMYGYHMEGKVLFILKSLSLVNHGRVGLNWRRIIRAQSAGTNAIISLLVPSLSILIQLDTMKQTQKGTTEDPSITHYFSFPRQCHHNLAIPIWYVLFEHCNVEKKIWVCQQVIHSAWLVVDWHRNRTVH